MVLDGEMTCIIFVDFDFALKKKTHDKMCKTSLAIRYDLHLHI